MSHKDCCTFSEYTPMRLPFSMRGYASMFRPVRGCERTWCRDPRLGRSLALPLALSCVVLSGCAHIPVVETAHYADAFHDVAAVTEELLSDYTVAVDAISAQESAGTNPPAAYPIQFDPALALASENPDPVALGFKNALRTVEEYNSALLALASGEDDLKRQGHALAAARLLETIGTGATPAAPTVAELMQRVLSLLAKARDHKQFAGALGTGRPVVDALLQNFVDATPDFYRVRVGIIGAAITEIEFKQESVLDELERIARDFAIPAAGSDLALRRAQVEAEVAALRAAISPLSAGQPLPAGALPYEADTQDRLEEQVRVLRGLCEQRRALAGGLTAYHGQLAEYVRLLSETRGYFDALLVAAGSPTDSEAVVRAHDVNAKAGALRAGMRASRSASTLPASENPKP